MEPGLGAVVQHMGWPRHAVQLPPLPYTCEADVLPLSSRFTESFFALAYSVSVALFIQAATMMRHQPPRQSYRLFLEASPKCPVRGDGVHFCVGRLVCCPTP